MLTSIDLINLIGICLFLTFFAAAHKEEEGMTSLAEFFWQGILQVHANQNQVDATDDHEPEGVSDAELLVL